MDIQCLVIDDDPFIRQTFTDLFEDHLKDARIAGFATNGLEGLDKIRQLKPDLIFLDVQMPDMTGFEMLQQIEQIDFQIIFVTAHSHYAIRAIRFNALDYLVKPIAPEELQAAMLRYQNDANVYRNNLNHIEQALVNMNTEHVEDQVLNLQTQEGELSLTLKNIIRIEGDRNYSFICLADGVKKLSSKTLGYFDEILAEKGFFRCHRSFLVNGVWVEKMQQDSFVLTDQSNIPISRRRKTEAKAWYRGLK